MFDRTEANMGTTDENCSFSCILSLLYLSGVKKIIGEGNKQKDNKF